MFCQNLNTCSISICSYYHRTNKHLRYNTWFTNSQCTRRCTATSWHIPLHDHTPTTSNIRQPFLSHQGFPINITPTQTRVRDQKIKKERKLPHYHNSTTTSSKSHHPTYTHKRMTLDAHNPRQVESVAPWDKGGSDLHCICFCKIPHSCWPLSNAESPRHSNTSLQQATTDGDSTEILRWVLGSEPIFVC